MNKIVSNFYLIRLDGDPVYVGYTNRPIKQRFSEHKYDKDFGDVEPTIESLGSLKYSFTWNIGVINTYAKEVSDRETELILEYGTQDSVWQKGVNGNIGGQTWSNIKNFVKTNRDNPTFSGLNEEIIIELLEWQRRSSEKLEGMINATNISGFQKLRGMVNNTNTKGVIKLRGMIKTTNIKGARKLEGMVTQTNIKGSKKLRDMVNNTNVKGSVKLRSMVTQTNAKGSKKLRGVIDNTNVKGSKKLRNMVNNTKIKS